MRPSAENRGAEASRIEQTYQAGRRPSNRIAPLQSKTFLQPCGNLFSVAVSGSFVTLSGFIMETSLVESCTHGVGVGVGVGVRCIGLLV